MPRALSLDLGSKRIGVAASDTTRTLASPVTVLERRGSHVIDHKAIREIIDEYEVDTVVVGLPLSLSGKESHAARLIRSEVAEMETSLNAGSFPVQIVLHDERFTTKTAHASMMERNMNAQARRRLVDKVAAAVLLQNWLDAQELQRERPTAEARSTEARSTETRSTEARSTEARSTEARSTETRSTETRSSDTANDALQQFLSQPVQPRSPRK
jgi:putative holliday junction resolvase